TAAMSASRCNLYGGLRSVIAHTVQGFLDVTQAVSTCHCQGSRGGESQAQCSLSTPSPAHQAAGS
ncbi:MAG: hypothetical protein KAZ48_11400, partial [Candidatus Nanopelagicales bacterium]|nr:hypothetical protein [Candidatus Nanopelagicales bacterium]